MSQPLFRRLVDTGEAGAKLTIYFEGQAIEARAGDTVAAALLAAGIRDFRTGPAGAAPGAPFCMAGACQNCLLEIDGEGNRQSCLVEARDGMRVRPMPRRRPIDGDA
ncbi:MAG: (2Fe-2S)-binding protein [Alphaproteobacteria bacterium]|nr:(2Fe-2S)-binding protein [Alphaproteobacteria bacterium]